MTLGREAEGPDRLEGNGTSSAGAATDTTATDNTRPAQLAAVGAGLAAVGALVGAILRVLSVRRARRTRVPPLARVAHVARHGVATGSSALLPVASVGGRLAARAGERLSVMATRTARTGARGAAVAAETGLSSAAAAAASAAKGASKAAEKVGRAGGAVASVPEVAAEQGHQLHKRWRSMVRTSKFVLALAAGFVLGARDGRERYEQLTQALKDLAQRPELQQVKGRLAGPSEQRGRGADTIDLDDPSITPTGAPETRRDR